MSEQKSTNGRSKSMPAAPPALQLIFRLLERAAPSLGAAMIDRLWFTVPKVPEKARRLRAALPPGQSFEVRLGTGMIRGTSWGTGRPVYLVHGWGGWGLQLAAYVSPLLDAGFRVVAYDAPSHGSSDPGHRGAGRSDLPELTDALQAVIADQGTAYGIVAHSFGAAATTHALLDGLAVRRIVFVAAPADFDHSLDHFERGFSFGPRIRARFLRRFTRQLGRTLDSFDVLPTIDEILQERDLPPLLAIHDTDDHETLSEGSAEIVAAWPGAELRLTTGLGHRKVLGDPASVASVVAFLSAALSVAEPVRASTPAVQETMRG